MSERSFAVWSVGLSFVFAIVVPEPDGQKPSQAPAGMAAHLPPREAAPLTLPQPVAAPARVQALAPPSAPYALERASAVQPAPNRPLLWAVHAAP
ncbi:MAG: hypothetical protein ACXWVG_00485 [Telluria sp.]